jgi:hypothetical protein
MFGTGEFPTNALNVFHWPESGVVCDRTISVGSVMSACLFTSGNNLAAPRGDVVRRWGIRSGLYFSLSNKPVGVRRIACDRAAGG